MKNEVRIVNGKIIINYNGTFAIRTVDDIRFCKSTQNNSEIFLDAGKSLVVPLGLNKLALLLPERSFCKIHNRYIVHLGIMQKAIVKDGKILYRKYIIPITRDYIVEFIHKAEAFHTSG